MSREFKEDLELQIDNLLEQNPLGTFAVSTPELQRWYPIQYPIETPSSLVLIKEEAHRSVRKARKWGFWPTEETYTAPAWRSVLLNIIGEDAPVGVSWGYRFYLTEDGSLSQISVRRYNLLDANVSKNPVAPLLLPEGPAQTHDFVAFRRILEKARPTRT